VRFPTLDDLAAADAARVGGKAWNCARLKQRGFPVPDGLVILAEASDADLAAVDRHTWFEHWPPNERFAVRSSGLAEDAPEQSFAGVHDTRLNVRRPDLLDAVLACRASANSERAKAYRRARALPATATATGVLIQRMIQPVASGVAFTIDPLTGATDELVVNSAPGLGAALVDGQVDPDEIRIRKRDAVVVFRRAGGVSDGPKGPSLHDVGVLDGLPKLTLTDAQIQELASLLLAIEREYGSPQDVEWCHDGAQFWIVQSRPITTHHNLRPSRVERRLSGGTEVGDIEWTRANLAEVLPELTSPQALAVFEDMLNTAERHHLGRLLAPYDALGPMVKPFYGRLYFNLSQLRHVCLMGFTAPAGMLRSLGHAGEIRAEDERIRRPPLLGLLKCLPDFARLLSRHFRAAQVMRDHESTIAAFTKRVASVNPEQLTDFQIWTGLADWQREGTKLLEVVLLFGSVMIHEVLLRKICERLDFPFERLLYSHLAVGERSVSAQQAFDLVALADLARDEPRAATWLSESNGQPADIRVALHGTAFLAAFDSFLDRYGHRGLYESDWALPRYSEDPTPLLQAIRTHLRDGRDDSRAAALVRVAAEADAVRSEFERRMTGVRRWTLLPRARQLLATIKQYYVWREQCRSDMIRVLAIMRPWHLVLARRFVERGWLDRLENYFLLRIEEIASAIQNPAASNTFRDIVAQRAVEAERYRRFEMPLLMRESELPRLMRASAVSEVHDDDRELRGVPVSRGSVEGEVVVIDDPGDFAHMKRGAILVTRATDPSWTPLFTLASGVIVEVGGVLSHASTVAREYGIPALANVRARDAAVAHRRSRPAERDRGLRQEDLSPAMLASADAPSLGLVRRVRRDVGVVSRRGADPVSLVVSRTPTPVDAGRCDVSRRRRAGHARVAHEPLVSGSLLAARLCQERLRRARVRLRWTRAADEASGPVRMERQWPRWLGDREVQGLRRSPRRHVSRRRYHSRAHQHAGGHHVGARARRSAGDDHLRAAARHALAGGDAASRDRRRTSNDERRTTGSCVYGAKPPVSDGQPRRVRSRHAARVHGRTHEIPLCRASHGDGCRARRVRHGRREDRAAGRRDLRRVSRVRAGRLHLRRRLSALCKRRRHGAP